MNRPKIKRPRVTPDKGYSSVRHQVRCALASALQYLDQLPPLTQSDGSITDLSRDAHALHKNGIRAALAKVQA